MITVEIETRALSHLLAEIDRLLTGPRGSQYPELSDLRHRLLKRSAA